MIRFVVQIYVFVGLFQFSFFILLGTVNQNSFRLGMSIDEDDLPRADASAATMLALPLGPTTSLKKSGFTHHWAPTRFIPTDTAVFEGNLKMSVIDFVCR